MNYEARLNQAMIANEIPQYMHGGITRYVMHGIAPGGFLSAVVENDLCGALGRADDTNRSIIWNYVNLFYNDAPSECWGSPDMVNNWIKSGGVNGTDKVAVA